MVIAIEAQRIFRENKHGMDFVALELIRELQKTDKVNQYYIITAPGPDRSVLSESSNFKVIELSPSFYPLWEQVALPLFIKKLKPDLLHCTSNTAPLWGNTPLVLTLHDVIFLEKRREPSKSLYQNMGWYYRRFIVPGVLKRCRLVITVSEYEKRVINDKLDMGDKVAVVYNGFGKHFKVYAGFEEVMSRYVKDSGYLFFLGNTDPKKNTTGVLKAYSLYLEKAENPRKLVIADLKEDDVKQLVVENNIKEVIMEHIIAIGYVPNRDLPFLYNGAHLFLYPSLRESFGIPQLEAMACGTPVITSGRSAMPEISGDAAFYVDPYNEQEIADAIFGFEDNSFYNHFISRGFDRVLLFSWQKTAEDVLNHYNSVYNEKDD
jgi:glycosyltransferase involved in cell wall biosynthesis